MDKLIFKATLALFVIFSGFSPKALVEKGSKEACNTLILNGKVTDEAALSSVTAGKLGLVSSRTGAGKPGRVSFYAYLIRAGKIVDADAFAHNNAVTEIEISEILRPAKDGDLMVIDPAGESASKNRRVIVVRQKQYTPQFNWWPGQKALQKDGC